MEASLNSEVGDLKIPKYMGDITQRAYDGFEKYYTELIKGYSTLKPEEKILVRREYGTNIPIL